MLDGGSHVTVAAEVLRDTCVTFTSVRFSGLPGTITEQNSKIKIYCQFESNLKHFFAMLNSILLSSNLSQAFNFSIQ